MTFPDRRRIRALDDDPTMQQQRPFIASWAPRNGSGHNNNNNNNNNNKNNTRSRWPITSTKTWGDGEDDSSESPSPAINRSKESSFHLSYSEDISSIDKPIDRSGLIGTGLLENAPSFSDSEPSLGFKKREVKDEKKEATPERKDKGEIALVTPASSPLRYRRSNQQQRRELAKKILMSRKKANTKVESDNTSSEKEVHVTTLPVIPVVAKGIPVTQPYTIQGGMVGTWATPPKPINNSEAEANTRAPDSDETVSWASTLTTDPSRLVSQSQKLRMVGDEKTRQVPYLKIEAALPSLQELPEPPQGKLDRHFRQEQQRSIDSHSSKQKSTDKKSSSPRNHYENYHQQEQEKPQQKLAPENGRTGCFASPYNSEVSPRTPSQQSSPEIASSKRSAAIISPDERDDRLQPHRHTNSGSQAELSDIYRRSAPDRSMNALSDPGLSNLALAASQWPSGGNNNNLPNNRPSPLINYGSTEDVLVTLHPGGETFEHSSHILAYASPILRQKLHPVLGGWYRLSLYQTTSVEWQLIRPFLEPHSVQTAVVTPSNMTYLLPWFVQLKLDILLAECDHLLVTLDFAKAYTGEGTNPAASADPSSLPSSIPHVQDMVDILLLTEISSLALLNKTCEKSLDILESYLALHPGLAAHDEALPILMRILQDHPKIRQRLWRRSLIRFLPCDLPVFQNTAQRSGEEELHVVETIVYNSLFSFLLREGLHKASREDEYNQRKLDLEERWKRFRDRQQKVQQTSNVYRSSIRENSILEDPRNADSTEESTIGSSSLNNNSLRADSVNTDKLQQAYSLSPSPLTMFGICEEGCDVEDVNRFRDWWIQVTKQARVAIEEPIPNRASMSFQDGGMPGGGGDARSKPLLSQQLKEEIDAISGPRSRTKWLELMLQRLNRPPIFPPEPGEEDDFPTAAKKDRRKFLC